jgi:HEAT repeat protein
MKESLINVYMRSGDKAAVDKLLTIVKGEENITVRRRAISQLSRSEDPRIKAALQDIVMK